MQPYLFPYIGYFQLICAVDTFVIYDDVNYIKQGWVNRNHILLDGRRHLITLALEGASSFKLINQITIGGNRGKLIKTISQAYRKSPYYEEGFPVIKQTLEFEDRNLAGFVSNSLRVLAGYLDMKTEFRMSSSIEKDASLKGQDKVLDICRILGAKRYVNAIGGMGLYDAEAFRENGIELCFLKTGNTKYKQFGNDFVPNLSIIDVLMFNSGDAVRKILQEYELIL